MKKSATNKIIVSLLAAATMAGTVASAAWEFSGYDTTNPPVYGKIYNEKINGSYTSKTKIDVLDPKYVEWKAEGFELEYPHAGYERLYLEGNAQQITRYNGQLPQWTTRFQDFMWEVAEPHRIYQRQQTYVPGFGWNWDFGNEKFGIDDSTVFVPTTRFAETVDSFAAYGVAAFDMDGKVISDETIALYNEIGINPQLYTMGYVAGYTDAFTGEYVDYPCFRFGPYYVELDEEGQPTKNIVDNTYFSDEYLSQINAADGQYVVSDFDIGLNAAYIDSKYVTGPSYYGENGTKNVAKIFTDLVKAGYDAGTWTWDADTVRNPWATITWTAPQYEMAEPYNYYQFMVVNGLVLDGSNDLPRVFRYTDGKASPKVEWKYQWAEAAYPYNVIEFKYVDGKQAFDMNGNPIYRIPTGEYGNIYFKTTATEIQLWVKDGRGGDDMIWSTSRVDANFGGGFGGFAPAAGYVIG